MALTLDFGRLCGLRSNRCCRPRPALWAPQRPLSRPSLRAQQRQREGQHLDDLWHQEHGAKCVDLWLWDHGSLGGRRMACGAR